MGTVEDGSKIPPGDSSPSPPRRRAKPQTLDKRKNIEQAVYRSEGYALGTQENGSTDSKGLAGDMVEKHFKFAGVGDGYADGLADSEMNGISSLLKLREESVRQLGFPYVGGSVSALKLGPLSGSEDFAEIEVVERKKGVVEEENTVSSLSESEGNPDREFVAIDVPITEMSDDDEGEVEDTSYERYGYSVGDFVWGKIKSHPWWPGRIYDPLDASDYASKLRKKNRLLVAYFGDGTFAWCHPSKLKPFGENFEEMLKHSNSRAYFSAIQEAVCEAGRLVHLKIASLVAEENMSRLDRLLANNSGIKEGVVVPRTGIEKLSTALFNAGEILSRVEQIAEVTVSNALELEILKGQLSAFYHWKGGYKLPMYLEPQLISGLEGSSVDRVVHLTNSNCTVEVPIQRPIEDGRLPSLLSPKFGETSVSLLQKYPGTSEDIAHHWIKQKSIAEIMGGDKESDAQSKDRNLAEVTITNKKVVPSGRKRKYRDEGNSHSGNIIIGSSGQRRNTGLHGSSSSSHGSFHSTEHAEENAGSKLESDKAPALAEESLDGIALQSEDGQAKGEGEKNSSSRERKKSKYLSPPFTNINRGQKKREIETESLKISNEVRLSEQMTRVSGNLIGSPPIFKHNNEVFQDNVSKELTVCHEPSDDVPIPRTPKLADKHTVDPLKILTNEVLSEVRSAAADPLCPMEANLLQAVGYFLSIFRSSTYHAGSNYKAYNRKKPGRKRKNPELEKDQKSTNQKSSHHESESEGKRRKKVPNVKKMPEQSRDAIYKRTRKVTECKDSPAADLFVTFGPACSMPTKADLINIYSKCGALDESETDMFYISHCARVTFMRRSDAEAAFSGSQSSSLFGSADVNFRLQYRPDAPKVDERGGKSQSKSSRLPKAATKTPKRSLAREASQLDFIKQKLQKLTSMLEASDGMVSPDMKRELEGELRSILGKVNSMVESSS